MDIRERVQQRLWAKNWTPTDLSTHVTCVGRRGLSKRQLYDFLNGGKTLNSDALGVVLDALDLALCLTPQVQARVDADAAKHRQRLDAEQAARRVAEAERESRFRLTDADHEQAFGESDRGRSRTLLKPALPAERDGSFNAE